MIIVIEGHDGCGKDTVASAVSAQLSIPVLVFPDRATVSGQEIDRQLKQGIPSKIAFKSLHLVNKVEKIDELRRCAGSRSSHLILVRYYQSAMVYGYVDGVDQHWTAAINTILPAEDLAILLDADPSVLASRRQGRGGKCEAYEVGDLDERIVEAYRGLWDSTIGGVVIDASRPADQVMRDAINVIRRRMVR